MQTVHYAGYRGKSAQRALRLWLLASLLLSFCVFTPSQHAASAVASPALPAPDPASPFGVAGAMRWPDWGSFSLPADAMLGTGGSWVREDFVWGLIEPRKGVFDWTATDRLVGALRSRNLNVLGILSYSANWATPSPDDDRSASPVSFYMPDLGEYANYVRTLVGHYKGSVRYWEVWNEPDSDLFWRPKPDPCAYAELLKTAYRAIKEADPSAQVLTGGVSGNAVPFLEEMERAGAGDSYDILAIHPYAIPLDQAQGRVQSLPDVHKVRDVELPKYRAFLERHGHNRPLWVTEIGWPAGDWGLDEQAQADYLAQAYAQVLSSGLAERVFWYSFKDASAKPEDSWGLVSWGAGLQDLNARRPAYAAYAASARLLAGARPAGRLPLGSYSLVESFAASPSAPWTRSNMDRGSFTISTEQHRTGPSAGKLQYNFTSTNQAVDFAAPQPIPLSGKPNRLGLWALGDASGNYLSAWLRDRDGELFKVRLGAVTGPQDGWRYYEAHINGYYFDWEYAPGSAGGAANGVPDYPLNFLSFRLENTPDEPAGSGVIYVDDLLTFDGPDADAVRFLRPDGQVVDVLWSANPAQVSLSTLSAEAGVTQRDGTTRTMAARGGALSLSVGSSPIYVVHKPAAPQPPQPVQGAQTEGSKPAQPPPNNSSPGSAVCAAAQKVGAGPAGDSLYFSETGHNLGKPFRRYWEEHGAVAVLGFPITEPFSAPSSNGKSYPQQYFQRARLEYHPENQAPEDIQLGLLGVWLTEGRNFGRVPAPQTQQPSLLYFPQTGQALNLFSGWWNRNGGLPVFGYPLSGEMQEQNQADGKLYTVQYLERNRLEYHPEYKGSPQEVLLGLLGVEYLGKQGCGGR